MNSSTLASEKLSKAISHEQFDRVIEAILDGKYSWACVLLLSSAGYNPLHYIPYRTYNRLSKDNSAKRDSSGKSVGNVKANSKPGEIAPDRRTSEQHSNKIKDLNYLEAVKEPCKQLRGGTKDSWFVEQFQGYFASRGNMEQTQEIYRAL